MPLFLVLVLGVRRVGSNADFGVGSRVFLGAGSSGVLSVFTSRHGKFCTSPLGGKFCTVSAGGGLLLFL